MDFWEWVALVAFDGIAGAVVGGLIGGVAAWALLRVTLRHESDVRRVNQVSADAGEVRRSAARLLELAGDAILTPRTETIRPGAKRVVVEAIVLEAFLWKYMNGVAATLRANRLELREATSPESRVTRDRVLVLISAIEEDAHSALELVDTLVVDSPLTRDR